ncbi:MAG TPA: helix-turn-helix domain-containing protein [Clostridium sp.]
MDEFRNFLKELKNITGIDLSISENSLDILILKEELKENAEKIQFEVLHGSKTVRMELNKVAKYSLPLLKYVLENKLKELYPLKENIIIDILNGKEISSEEIQINLPMIFKGVNLICFGFNGNKKDALNVIHEIYEEEEVVAVDYGDLIVIIGIFEDVEEHCKSIIRSITEDLYLSVSSFYSENITDLNGLKSAFNEAKECLELKEVYKIKENILNSTNVFFEKLIYNIKDEIKEDVVSKFSYKFRDFGSEMRSTAEGFVKCDLNISETAKMLFIHRNTLIYRLDKIKKDTGFDIRNFREATLFKAVYLICKEKQ